jgi:hypothetical protein
LVEASKVGLSTDQFATCLCRRPARLELDAPGGRLPAQNVISAGWLNRRRESRDTTNSETWLPRPSAADTLLGHTAEKRLAAPLIMGQLGGDISQEFLECSP